MFKNHFFILAIEGEYSLFISNTSRLYNGKPEPPYVKFQSPKVPSEFPNIDPWTWKINLMSDIKGRYVTLQKIGKGNMYVYEIEAFGYKS